MEIQTNFLDGIRVVELATFVAAPCCGRALAEWGADVIKVESLNGDPVRFVGPNFKMPSNENENPIHDLENSNKKSVALNLKTPEAKEVFEKLLSKADVFLTNLRTEALIGLGVDYETLSKKFPQLIFAQILGYGEKGPDKDKPGFDYTAYYARGGVMGTLCEKDTSPLNGAPGFGDHQAGMYLLSGICAALYKRVRTGKGDKVTVSLLHTAIFGMGIMVAASQYGNHWPITRLEPSSPLLNAYKTKDGRWIQIAIPEYDKYIGKFAKAIGNEILAENINYNNIKGMIKNREEIVFIIEEKFIKKNLNEWIEILTMADIPFEKVQLFHEIPEDKQAWANDYLYNINYENGNKALVHLPVKFNSLGTPDVVPAPKIGEHTDITLINLGYTTEEIEKLRVSKIVR